MINHDRRVLLGFFYKLTLFFSLVVLFFSSPFTFLKAEMPVYATDWAVLERSKLRVIAGEGVWLGKRETLVGIEVLLEPDWKTYWRQPGDAGIPPRFEFKGSTNLKKAQVLYPVPNRYHEPSGLTIGYKSRVVFPVIVEAVDPLKPIKLSVSAVLGVCHDLCIPIQAEQSLEIKKPGLSPFSAALGASLAEVPVPLKADAAYGVQKAWLHKGAPSSLRFFIKTKKQTEPLELFVESLDGLYVPTPKYVPMKGQEALMSAYHVDLSDDDVADFENAELVCTLKFETVAFVQPCPIK